MRDFFFSFLSKITSGIEGVENEEDMLIRLIVSALVFLLLVVFRNHISKTLVWLLCRIFKGSGEKAQRAIKNSLTKPLAFFIAVLLILEQFGISASRIFAALGIGGVAVAFACKDTVENMLSGFIIIFDKPFEVDDVIEINGETGTVEDIKIRTTRVRAVDGSEKIYPNTVMAGAAITNWTRMKKRSFEETLWINYKHSREDIEKFSAGLKKIIDTFDNVLKDDVRVNFSEYGTNALEMNMFFYVDTIKYADYQNFRNNLNLAIKAYADSSSIELAFPSNTLYFGDELKIAQK